MSKGGGMPRDLALAKTQGVIEELQKTYGDENIWIAGSCRRMCPVVGDVDIVVVGDRGGLPNSLEVTGGDRRADLEVDGVVINLLFAEPEHLGAALLYFTGSKQFNIRTRSVAAKKGLLLNDRGVFEKKGEEKKLLASETELACLKAIGLDWIEPKDRVK